MTQLTLAQAEGLAKQALATAKTKAMNPMAVAVIDASGQLKYAVRQDGSGLAGIDIALAKARAALTFGCTSRQIADALADNPLAGPSVIAALDGKIILLPGGVLIADADGVTIGAIGAAGDAPDNDEAIVLAATGGAG